MDKSIINLNDRLKSFSLLEILIGLVIAFIASSMLSKAFGRLGIIDHDFSILFAIFLVFLFLFRGVKDLKPRIDEIFIEKNRNEALYLFICNFFFGFFVLSFFGTFDSSFSSGLQLSYDSGFTLLLSVLSSVIFAPIVEELLFRGIIFNKLNSKISVLYAVIITSLLFSAFHGFGRLLVTFIFSIALCIIYLKTENILIPIFIHILNNLIGTILTDFSHIEPIAASTPISYIMLIISIIAGILMIKYIRDNFNVLKS